MLNAPFIFLSLLPFANQTHLSFQRALKFIFVFINGLGLLLNCIDMPYFKFTLKRTTAELFFIRDDIGNLLGRYILDYWYIALLWLILLFLLIKFYPKNSATQPSKFSVAKSSIEFLVLISAGLLSLLGIRGGFQLKPLRIITAAEYTEARNIPLVINTPFSVIKSINSDYISEYKFYTTTNVENLYPFIHKGNEGDMNKQNVVIIILESFSKEYIGYFNHGKGYTPFLDSLLPNSLYFDESYANGKKSIEGIPAVLAGLPSLMENPYITSVYGSNQISGLGTLLKAKGYQTSFYHGGSNGTMGFDAFCKIAGFEKYYGRNEYKNETDFDGNWGIYDEAFFNYFAHQLEQEQSPFCSAFFSLSSHHPYSIPKKYQGKFPKGTLEIHESIGYADYSLAQFFHLASTMKWFKNTLFVITADHTSLSESPYYRSKAGIYAVPILFYKGDNSLNESSSITAQQIDVLPTVLDFLNYNENYFSFGKSLLKKQESHFAINYLNGLYQSISKQNSLLFDGEKVIGFYNLKQDSLMNQNLMNQNTVQQKNQEEELKKFIQHFNSSVIQNKMTAK